MVTPALPYALAFAAGAMIFVVVEELIPESQTHGATDLATIGTMIGFVVMMILDVALGRATHRSRLFHVNVMSIADLSCLLPRWLFTFHHLNVREHFALQPEDDHSEEVTDSRNPDGFAEPPP